MAPYYPVPASINVNCSSSCQSPSQCLLIPGPLGIQIQKLCLFAKLILVFLVVRTIPEAMIFPISELSTFCPFLLRQIQKYFKVSLTPLISKRFSLYLATIDLMIQKFLLRSSLKDSVLTHFGFLCAKVTRLYLSVSTVTYRTWKFQLCFIQILYPNWNLVSFLWLYKSLCKNLGREN